MAQKTWDCTKDKVTRYTHKTGQGASAYLPVGWGALSPAKQRHYIYLHFDVDWASVGRIVRAELVLTTANTHNWSYGTKSKVRVGRLEGTAWTEGTAPDGTWRTNEYLHRSAITTGTPAKYDISTAENLAHYLDITPLIEQIAPTSVKRRDGSTPGGAKTFRGLRIWTPSDDPGERTEFWGRTASTSSRRPRIILTYDVGVAAPSAPTLGSPSGSVAPGTEFEVTFQSAEASDRMGKVEVKLWNAAGTTELWKREYEVSEPERVSGIFTTGLPTVVVAGTTYQWAARTADTSSKWGPFATKKSFTVNNTVPTVSVIDPPSALNSLTDFYFRAEYADADDDPLKWFRVQVSSEVDPEEEWTDFLWDSDIVAPSGGEIKVPYGGAALESDTTYGYRIMAVDARGGESEWDYGTFTTSETYLTEPDPDGVLFSGYNRVTSPYRIVLREVNKVGGRAPAAVKAIITDASNIGVSYFANSPGDIFFTLPTDHPQVSACDPYLTHWSLQFYRGDKWVEKFAGLLTDFDATEDEVIIYGIDYLGLLTFSADERYDLNKVDKPYTEGGSKYSNVQLHTIIGDQIDVGKAQTGSTYGFITRPTSSVLWDNTLAERATIVTTFNQTYTSVMGLIESHKQGTGRRTRLWVEKTGESAYRWRLKSNTGQDRPNLRIELGGLLNGYRVVGFGDFGTIVHGIGRVRDQTTLRYEKAMSPINDGVDDAVGVWGRISKPMLWNDLLDESDLKRRVAEVAMRVGKIGKTIALPIRVHGLEPLDGFDVLDSFPLEITNGVVDTARYGSGMYTIEGVVWRLYPDGHTDLVLSVTPKEDGAPVNPEPITDSNPILAGSDWVIDYGGPDEQTSGKWYLDLSTGQVYRWDSDLAEWVIHIPDIWPLMVFVDPDNPDYRLKIENGVLYSSTDGGVTWNAIADGSGSIGDGIGSGTIPGGSNLIPDGSFEMSPFPTGDPTLEVWDTDTDFAGVTKVGVATSGSGTSAVIRLDPAP